MGVVVVVNTVLTAITTVTVIPPNGQRKGKKHLFATAHLFCK